MTSRAGRRERDQGDWHPSTCPTPYRPSRSRQKVEQLQRTYRSGPISVGNHTRRVFFFAHFFEGPPHRSWGPLLAPERGSTGRVAGEASYTGSRESNDVQK